MNVSEEMLGAYLDGELDDEGVATVERAMRDDPGLVAAVARGRALREQLRQAYAPMLVEPLPARLLAPLSRNTGGHRRSGARRGRWQPPQWAALAAALVLGVIVAPWARQALSPELLQPSPRGLVAGGELAHALDRRLASDIQPGTDRAITTGLSFRARDGRYCRSFALPARALAGLACRDADGWQLAALGQSVPVEGELRRAASPLPPALLAEIDARLDGEPLDAAGERAARDAGWE